MRALFQPELLAILLGNGLLWLWVWLAPPLVVRANWLPGSILGLAFPGLILVRPETFTGRILRHELTHIRQMRRWSPLGTYLAQAWNYLLRPLAILLRQRRRPGIWELYWSNPLEREAFAAMDGEAALPRTWGARPEG